MEEFDFNGKSAKEVFSKIHATNFWGGTESVSGSGSGLDQTREVIAHLNRIISDLDIQSMLDLPCGDFAWMQHVDLSSINYIGGDIVEALIQNNQAQYEQAGKIEFKQLDLLSDPLPKCDLLLVRDCLVHFSIQDIFTALKNIKASGSKYLLTTTFVHRGQNMDITTGHWRPINLQESPFHFPLPLQYVNELCTEGERAFIDKSLGLWNIEGIYITEEV